MLGGYGFAQSTSPSTRSPFGEGWHFSLTVDPSLQREESFTIYVPAADTIARPTDFEGMPLRLRDRRPDTLFNGTELLGEYFSEPELGRRRTLADRVWQVRFTVKAHRRYASGIELSYGLNYQAYQQTATLENGDGLPEDAFYFVADKKIREGGVSLSASYHFLKESRFQPYVGMQMRFNVNYQLALGQRLVSPFNDIVIEREITEQFRRNTIFDLDTRFIAGFSYQVLDNAAIGLEVDPLAGSDFFSPALQIRYRLPNRGGE
ncbi:hypothetical protein A3850_008375 [Lewinella sp. 4G2]|nr:hypothetical protein A3850_008375 [Lewinella sp. 4G2]